MASCTTIKAATILAAALRTNAIRQSRITAPHSHIANDLSTPQAVQRVVRPAFVPARWHSAPPARPKTYDFNAISALSSSPSPEQILIDVREPSEYAEGFIPGAINIPIKSQPDAMLLPADEFEDRFGFGKPEADKEVIFYCKSGVRSSAAAQLAQQVGYKNVAEYRGSWMDWQKNGGQAGK